MNAHNVKPPPTYVPSKELERARAAATATHTRLLAVEAEAAALRDAAPELRKSLDALADAAVAAGKRLSESKEAAALETKISSSIAGAERLTVEAGALRRVLEKDLAAVTVAEEADLRAHGDRHGQASAEAMKALEGLRAALREAEQTFMRYSFPIGYEPGAWGRDLVTAAERNAKAAQQEAARQANRDQQAEAARQEEFRRLLGKAHELLGRDDHRLTQAQVGQRASEALAIAKGDAERAEAEALLAKAPREWETILATPTVTEARARAMAGR